MHFSTKSVIFWRVDLVVSDSSQEFKNRITFPIFLPVIQNNLYNLLKKACFQNIYLRKKCSLSTIVYFCLLQRGEKQKCDFFVIIYWSNQLIVYLFITLNYCYLFFLYWLLFGHFFKNKFHFSMMIPLLIPRDNLSWVVWKYVCIWGIENSIRWVLHNALLNLVFFFRKIIDTYWDSATFEVLIHVIKTSKFHYNHQIFWPV